MFVNEKGRLREFVQWGHFTCQLPSGYEGASEVDAALTVYKWMLLVPFL